MENRNVAKHPAFSLGQFEPEWHALSEVIGRIYECAIDPGQWDDTLHQIVSLLGPAEWDIGFLIWERTAPPGGRFVGTTAVIPVAREIYLSTHAGRNPWTRRIANLPVGRVVDTDEILPRSEFLDSALYQNFLSAWSIELAVAVVLDRKANERLALVTAGPRDRPLDGLKRGLRLLAPHMQRAVRISRSLGEANLRTEAANSALERAPLAIATLTTNLQVVNANEKFLALARGNGVTISRGAFCFSDREAQTRLVQLAASTEPASAAFSISSSDGSRQAVLAARISTQSVETLGGTIEGASIVVSIGVGGRAPLIAIDRLRAWYGLTPAEARLATALGSGDNLGDYALRRDVSMNAVRYLLKGIYRKTGATSQAKLVSAIRNLPTSQ